MAIISELIRKETDGSISFGDYSLGAKAKKDGFEVNGDIFKVKTFREITRLEKNGTFAYESVPGTVVTEFSESEDQVVFTVEGPEDAQITVGMEEDTEYDITIGGSVIGSMKTNLGGKLSFSVELDADKPVEIRIARKG